MRSQTSTERTRMLITQAFLLQWKHWHLFPSRRLETDVLIPGNFCYPVKQALTKCPRILSIISQSTEPTLKKEVSYFMKEFCSIICITSSFPHRPLAWALFSVKRTHSSRKMYKEMNFAKEQPCLKMCCNNCHTEIFFLSFTVIKCVKKKWITWHQTPKVLTQLQLSCADLNSILGLTVIVFNSWGACHPAPK